MNLQRITHDVMRERLGALNQGMPGMAKGGSTRPTIGLIRGEVDPTVADDTTITTPSGAQFNAKIGEYVLPVEVVAAMGGPKVLDSMVANMKQHMGLPTEVGPKTHDMPDSMGRMDKPGLPMMMGGADGASIYGRKSEFDDVANATGNAISGAVKALPVVGTALASAYTNTLGNKGYGGSGAQTYPDDPYSIGSLGNGNAPPPATEKPSVGLPQSTPSATTPPAGLPQSAPRQAAFKLPDIVNNTTITPEPTVGLPTSTTPDALKRAMNYTPEKVNYQQVKPAQTMQELFATVDGSQKAPGLLMALNAAGAMSHNADSINKTSITDNQNAASNQHANNSATQAALNSGVDAVQADTHRIGTEQSGEHNKGMLGIQQGTLGIHQGQLDLDKQKLDLAKLGLQTKEEKMAELHAKNANNSLENIRNNEIKLAGMQAKPDQDKNELQVYQDQLEQDRLAHVTKYGTPEEVQAMQGRINATQLARRNKTADEQIQAFKKNSVDTKGAGPLTWRGMTEDDQIQALRDKGWTPDDLRRNNFNVDKIKQHYGFKG